jgi:S1-C subfamily serine protease
VVITGVLQNGPAAQAGLRPGDLIVAVNDRTVNSVPELLSQVASLKPGQKATLSIVRRQVPSTLTVVPGRRSAVRQRQ